MKNLTFKYTGITPLDFLISNELMNKINYLQLSRVEQFPLYQTDENFMFNKNIITILNDRNFNLLKLLLRRKKLEKMMNIQKTTLHYEFLDFWYNNSDDLYLMLQMS